MDPLYKIHKGFRFGAVILTMEACRELPENVQPHFTCYEISGKKSIDEKQKECMIIWLPVIERIAHTNIPCLIEIEFKQQQVWMSGSDKSNLFVLFKSQADFSKFVSYF